MKYKLGDLIQIKSTGDFKKVVDCELIDSQEIYYMSDKTSYHISEIDNIKPVNFDELTKKICSNSKLIEETTKDYAKEIAKKTIKWSLY